MVAETGCEPGRNPKQNFEHSDVYLSIAAGWVKKTTSVNKFGRADNCDNNIKTDVWDRANQIDNQPIWLAPTAARIHDIVSSDANDTLLGAGARTVIIYGLKDWLTHEAFETIELNGITPVQTINSYVIIHRIICLSWGPAGPNVGQILATAQVDATVTAQIQPGLGQTQMAIYGVPSIHKVYATQLWASILKPTGANIAANVEMLVNPIPDQQTIGFISKRSIGISTLALPYADHSFKPYKEIIGPAIIKMQTITDGTDADVTAGFDLIEVDQD